MQRVRIAIESMSCGHCVNAVRSALSAIDGVQVEQVSVGSAVVSYDPARANTDGILRAIADEGYQARSAA